MMDYLLNHIIEIIAILVALVIFFLQQRRKVLTYNFVTNTSVISIDNMKNDIQVTYKGSFESSVQLVEIEITNGGNLPIKPEDYVEQLAIRYPVDIKLLSAEIIDNNSLGIFIEPESSKGSQITLS